MNFSAIATPIFWIEMAILVIAITLHEFGHAKFADMAGDPTPRMMGRVTLNPLSHLDPVGTIMMFLSALVGYGIGWGKPVRVRPDKMRNPRWDDLACAAAGPLMNLILAFLFAFSLRLLAATGPLSSDSLLVQGILQGVLINLSLMLFNLIPIGPLDGHWILGAFLPDRLRYEWFKFNRGIGTFIFLGLVLFPGGSNILRFILEPTMKWLIGILLG